MPVSSPSDLDFVKCMIMGDIGIGKTRLCGTAQLDPRTSPTLLIDFEGGSRTLKGLDIDVFRVRGWDDFDDAYDLVARRDTKYKSVTVDSTTETHVYALLTIIEEEKAFRKSKKQRTDIIQEGDYGIGLVQMRRFLRSFRDLEMHVFFTALKQEVLEPGYGMVNKPSFAGKLTNEIPMLLDVVGGLTWLPNPNHEDKLERALLLKNYPDWRVKIRTDFDPEGYPDEIYEPDITKLFDILRIPYPDGSLPKIEVPEVVSGKFRTQE